MQSLFNSEFFAHNRRRLREQCRQELIVVTANGRLQRSGDDTYTFKQDANFWYLTGLDEPDLVLVMAADAEYLIVPKLSGVREIFEGGLDKAELRRRSGISTILDSKPGWARLSDQVRRARQLATLPALPAYVAAAGFYANPARARLRRRLRALNRSLSLADIAPNLASLRQIKQPAELAAIRQAIAITAAGVKAALRADMLKHYRNEYEIEAALTREFRTRGAAGHGFEPIVAAGDHACTLHYNANSGRLRRGELVIVDVGAEVENYAADLTRTIATGQPSERQREVHAAVLEVQRYAISLLKPGALLKDYEKAVLTFMGEKLQQLGLIKTVTPQNIRRHFPHAASHFLGLNVHDVGLRTQPLEPDMVLTVEPGIYISEENLGVRLEDDVLITKIGAEVLSSALPHTLVI